MVLHLKMGQILPFLADQKKKWLNRARIGPLYAAGQGRISPLGNTVDLPWHFQALYWDFYVGKINVGDVRIFFLQKSADLRSNHKSNFL